MTPVPGEMQNATGLIGLRRMSSSVPEAHCNIIERSGDLRQAD